MVENGHGQNSPYPDQVRAGGGPLAGTFDDGAVAGGGGLWGDGDDVGRLRAHRQLVEDRPAQRVGLQPSPHRVGRVDLDAETGRLGGDRGDLGELAAQPVGDRVRRPGTGGAGGRADRVLVPGGAARLPRVQSNPS